MFVNEIMLFCPKLGQLVGFLHDPTGPFYLSHFEWDTKIWELGYILGLFPYFIIWFLLSLYMTVPKFESKVGITQSCWCPCFCFGFRFREIFDLFKGMSANTVRDQLHVLHDPFSAATSQPKIPDGKVNDSLGFSTQAVREFRNEEGINTLHMLLFAGSNTGLIVKGLEDPNAATRGADYLALGFTDSGGCNWKEIADSPPSPGDVILGGAPKTITPLEGYAMHRVVSCGMQLKLLNSVEEDDGWWEAVRVNEQFATEDYQLDQVDAALGEQDSKGCVIPKGLLDKLTDRPLTNDPTYATGLLRDLERAQFELHGRLDYHDFRRRHASDDVAFEDLDIEDPATGFLPGEFIRFKEASDNAREIVDQYIDPSYDMVYLRLHCRERPGGPLTPTAQGSRLHTNVVSNQEIYYNSTERDNRYHTMSPSVGSAAVSLHFQSRRANRLSAKLI